MPKGDRGWQFAEDIVGIVVEEIKRAGPNNLHDGIELVAEKYRQALLELGITGQENPDFKPVYHPAFNNRNEERSHIEDAILQAIQYREADPDMIWMFAEMLLIFKHKNLQYRNDGNPLANFELANCVTTEKLPAPLYAHILVNKQEELLDRKLWSLIKEPANTLDMDLIIELLRDKMVYCSIIYALIMRLRREEDKFLE